MVIWNEVGVEETSHNGFEGCSWAIEVTMFYLIDGSDPWLNGSIWVGSKWPNFLFLFPLLEADSMALPWVCIFIGLPLYGSFVCEDIKLAVSDTRLVLIKQLISTLVLHWKKKNVFVFSFWILSIALGFKQFRSSTGWFLWAENGEACIIVAECGFSWGFVFEFVFKFRIT